MVKATECIELLSTMIDCGEPHSKTSRHLMTEALIEIEQLRAQLVVKEALIDEGWQKSLEKAIKKNSNLTAQITVLREALKKIAFGGARSPVVIAEQALSTTSEMSI